MKTEFTIFFNRIKLVFVPVAVNFWISSEMVAQMIRYSCTLLNLAAVRSLQCGESADKEEYQP